MGTKDKIDNGKRRKLMRYDYSCNDCSEEDRTFLFETSYSISEKPPNVKCPRCDGQNTEQAFVSVPISYVRGYGWLDKKGRNRDRNLWKLTNEDPYGTMRVNGEADDLAHRLRTGGKYDSKPKTYAVSTKTELKPKHKPKSKTK